MDKNLKKFEEGEETKDANAEIDDESIDENFVYTLDEKFVKFYCRRCKLKRAAIRGKARCPKCKTQLTYSCETCNETYGNITDFSDHLKNEHCSQNTANGKIHPCLMCHNEFACQKRMLTDQSGSVEQHCAEFSEKFKVTEKKEKEKVWDEEATFKCDRCSFTTNLVSELVQHFKKHTGPKEKCEKCGKIFANPGSMRKHSRVCGKFYTKYEVLNHLDRVHFKGGLNSRACAHSDQTLGRYGHRSKYLRRCKSSNGPRTGVRICEYCGLTLRPRGWMKKHLGRCKFAPADRRVESCIADQTDLDTACENLSKAYCDSCSEKTPVKKGQPRCKKCDTPLKFDCERCPHVSFKNLGQLRRHLRTRHVKDN